MQHHIDQNRGKEGKRIKTETADQNQGPEIQFQHTLDRISFRGVRPLELINRGQMKKEQAFKQVARILRYTFVNLL